MSLFSSSVVLVILLLQRCCVGADSRATRSLEEDCAAAVQAYHDNSGANATEIIPSCLDEQECVSSLSGIDVSGFVCTFTLSASGFTHNSDYPNCTEIPYEDVQDLGEWTIPISSLADEQNHVISPSMLTMEVRDPPHFFAMKNLTVPWGIGGTCDGLLALFIESPNIYGSNPNEEFAVIAVGSLEGLSRDDAITGPGMFWLDAAAIHRERRAHVGCAIGGITEYVLQGTCVKASDVDSGRSSVDTSNETEVPSSSSFCGLSFSKSWLLLVLGMVGLQL
ncbi:expressed unknown protein [Seminavis robusta]|uniref:Uncharacterized protein n=1 Tax=Seminavis robusta TaxID=568900 RepID=A0A9N8E782_9STRA|nr:expressed unknown protein [Seminavis robusta]|eukprot:Sro695_g188740.1 n/a (279) ;mRNA; r:36634-37470